MNYVTLVPSYGRDYKSKKAVQADWDAGKDFTINQFGHPDDGRQINKQDAASTPGVTYNVRYNSLRSVHPIKIK
jgi:hypothetical protein